jgi:SPP1 gp7 family putative phage head morphogenesis protein
MKVVKLKPIIDSTEEWGRIEKHLFDILKREIYYPLIALLNRPKTILKNTADDLSEAIQSGRIIFYRGEFKGKFSASISRELKRLGAVWDRKSSSWKISLSALPQNVRSAISTAETKFQESLKKIDLKLSQILPEKIADSVKVSSIFDTALWKCERKIQDQIKAITVTPELTKTQRQTVAKEWENNLKLDIKKFSNEQILELRQIVKTSSYKGYRQEELIGIIQKNYSVGYNKAKFLARQETHLLMAKFKETRYKDSGVNMFQWKNVIASMAHPVRPEHKILDNKYFRWDDDREVNLDGTFKKGGARKPDPNKNPGEDYNCRCYAIPVVRF